jgi:hypothetical protein
MTSAMPHDGAPESIAPPANPFTASDVAEILRERGWLDPSSETPDDAALNAWLDRAAQLLGPHAPDRDALSKLLTLVFSYDAPALLRDPASQAALARSGAREVIRVLANQILEGGELGSDRFKQIIDALKEALPYRGQALFFPIRLALAGAIGKGALDRVTLLLDSAAKLPFREPVKDARHRILEFCAALD